MPGLLTHSPADVIRHMLISMGHGVLRSTSPNGSWPIFVGNESDSPNNAVSVFDTRGRTHGATHVDGQYHEHHGIQVLVRAETYPVGWTKADQIRNALEVSMYQEQVTISGTRYSIHSVARDRVGGVLALGKDKSDSKRSLFSINALVIVTML